MANIPGASGAVPGVITDVQTLSRGVSVPGGVRLTAIMGEGSRREILVAAALGSGVDGLNPTYTSTSGADGRHYTLSLFPLISNRTTIFRNGIPLVGLESVPNSNVFDYRYDYRIDVATGHIELQRAHLVDQSGLFYAAGSTNYGAGTITNLNVVDLNAPSESWTVKCSSVQRDGYGVPMSGTAKFVAFGTVSGSKLDGYGNPIVWLSDSNIVSNGTLSFSIVQSGLGGANHFKEGDTFTVKVASGVLLKNDTLTASYIALSDLNDPTFFDNMGDLSQRHGTPSLDNNLSLGSSLAFQNDTNGVVALQTAPALPRRTSYVLDTKVVSTSSNKEDYIFPLPVGVNPDVNSSIHFFVTNPTTGVEKQVIPNKLALYSLSDASVSPSLSTFIFSSTTYAFDYTAIQRSLVTKSASDGVITVVDGYGTARLSSPSFLFQASDVGLQVKIFDTVNPINTGTFTISSVLNGALLLTASQAFIAESPVTFEVIDNTQTGSFIVINQTVVPNGSSLRVSLIDARDVGFYDAGWVTALAALETADVDIVVPLPKQTISGIFQNTISHCRTMSNNRNKRERVAFIGAIQGLTPDNVLGNKPAAVEDIGVLEGIQGSTITDVLAGNTEDLANYSVTSAYGTTFRCVYFYPDQVVVTAGTDRVFVDGFYMAAAAAGFLCGITNVAVPLTNKVLSGITILKNKKYSPTVLEQLVAAGITVVQPVTGGGLVVQGKTTTASGFPEEEEISIIFIRDRIAKSLRTGFTGFIGNPEDPTLLASLTSRAVGLCGSFISQGLITQFDSLQVRRDPVDPRQWDIQVQVQPVYPVNWIYIKVGVGLI